MKKISVFLLCCFLVLIVSAQNGKVLESLSLESQILGKTVEYSVYLPPSYEEGNRKYPVLYLLHGYTDDETGWTQFGEVKQIADEQMQKVEVTDMIIAMPDAGLDWYVNSYDGKTRYEDFFIQEFIPHIEKTFQAKPQKQFRAVAGLSMGGMVLFYMHLSIPKCLLHPVL